MNIAHAPIQNHHDDTLQCPLGQTSMKISDTNSRDKGPAAAEETHLLNVSTSTDDCKTNNQTRDHARCILISTTASRFGSRMWEFATPLILLEWSPGSLAAPATLGLTCALFRTVISPMLGSLADDQWDRFRTVCIGTSMQAGGCLLSVGALLMWNALSRTQNNGHLLSFLLVILAGATESLGAQLASVAVKKEWVPIVFDEDNTGHQRRTKHLYDLILPESITLSFMNTTMTNIDLIAAMTCPIIAGWVLEILGGVGGSMQRGFVAIAIINVISFLPEILLLQRVYQSCPALQNNLHVESTASSHMNINETTTVEDNNPWIIWFKHPSGLPLLTISMASLYFTALSPSGVVLTAYLITVGLSPTNIGVFRGVGALSGLLGISIFSIFRKGDDSEVDDVTLSAAVRSIERLRRVSFAFLVLEVISVIVAAFAFSFINTNYQSNISEDLIYQGTKSLSWPILIFLSAIVTSRAGLYSFDVGILEIEQHVVDERYRNAVGSVEGSLCALCEMGMYVISIILADPSKFQWQVGLSASAVSIGGVSFSIFLCMYQMHVHHHHQYDDADCHHNHAHTHCHDDHVHTLQQERALKDNGYHVHLHRHDPYVKFALLC